MRMIINDLKNGITNFLNKLKVDGYSVSFAKGGDLNDKNTKRLFKSKYEKDKVLFSLYKYFKKKCGKVDQFKNVAINNPFVQEPSVTQRGEILHTIDGPMQLIVADVANLPFFNKSVVAPKYSLVCVDLFTSKPYTYGMKKKNQLPEKLEKFYVEIESLREYLQFQIG